MKNQKFEIAVAGYDYRFKTYARDGVEAVQAKGAPTGQVIPCKACPLRALPAFRGEAQFYTWLYRIAVNTAKNHLVAQKRRPPTADIGAEEAEHFAGAGRGIGGLLHFQHVRRAEFLDPDLSHARLH